MMKTVNETRGPLDAPDWFVKRCEELSRALTSTPKSVADGLWGELIQRGLVHPQPTPGRVLGPLGWKRSEVTHPTITTSNAGLSTEVIV